MNEKNEVKKLELTEEELEALEEYLAIALTAVY